MRLLTLMLLLPVLLAPFDSNATGLVEIWGVSRTHKISIQGERSNFSDAKIKVETISSNRSDAYDKTLFEAPFIDVCVASKEQISCSPQSNSIVAGVVYRRTPDGSARCFRTTFEWRYTCVQGCRKELPRYLWIDPFEC